MSKDSTRPVVILAAGRHGRNAADIVRWAGRTVLGFLDDTHAPGSRVIDIDVIGGFDRAADAALIARADFHVAIGNPVVRRTQTEGLLQRGCRLASAIHPSIVVSPSAELGEGLFIAPFVRIAARAKIGIGTVIDPFSTVGGDSELGAFTMLAAHCSLVAGSMIGAGSFVGTHASILGVKIGAGCIIGAGSVVRKDVPDGMRAFGVPAQVVGPADWSRPPV